ncbi:twin-arginine translocase TatA/TatE family subunit [Rhizobium leguminosarum]|nr:twin-arginine translocase TatA/TatE family subunit [Rhizobium leguminosarum]
MWHWLIVLAIVVILFGRKRVTALLSDLGKGVGTMRRLLSGQDDKED